jgi:hypothetical protein
MAHSTESSKSLIEILTLVTSANIRGSDNVFILRSFMYILKSIGHAVDSYLSVLTLKQLTLVAFTPLIYTFPSTDISSRPDFILICLKSILLALQAHLNHAIFSCHFSNFHSFKRHRSQTYEIQHVTWVHLWLTQHICCVPKSVLVLWLTTLHQLQSLFSL